MRKKSTRSPSESRAHWEDLEEWVRGQIQGLIQELLEGRDHRVVREGKVSPPFNPGWRPRLPEWVRQAAEADAELWDDPGGGGHESATSRSRSRGGCCRCSPARARRLPI